MPTSGSETVLPRRRRQRARGEAGAAADPPETDEGKAVYFMIADAQGPHPRSVDVDVVCARAFAGQKICQPALTDAEIETLEILADPELVRQIRRGERDASAGRVVEWKKGHAGRAK